jgi:transcriptional regulator with XRE-family HTH domain
MDLDIKDIYFLKRRKLGITLQEIADYLGVHKSSLSRYETGKMNFCLAHKYQQYIDSKDK